MYTYSDARYKNDEKDFCPLLYDKSLYYWEINNHQTENQLYYICNLITRCYMSKTLLSPHLGVQEILKEYKQSIFKTFKFNFDDFLSVGVPKKEEF